MLPYLSHAAHSGPPAGMGRSSSTLSGVQSATTAVGMPRLVVARITLGRDGRDVILRISIANSGTGEADNVRLKLVSLAGVGACSLPSGVTLQAGQATTVSLIFPNVPMGTQRLHLVGGCTIGSGSLPGSFISAPQVTVP